MSDDLFKELELALEDMSVQEPLYRPTAFWDSAARKIKQELLQHGVENFRRLPAALSFFVPTYGVPGNSLSPK